MRVLCRFARFVTALLCLYLWAVRADYLSECVPDEWVSPGPDYGETGYDYTYTFRLSEGAVLEMVRG